MRNILCILGFHSWRAVGGLILLDSPVTISIKACARKNCTCVAVGNVTSRTKPGEPVSIDITQI